MVGRHLGWHLAQGDWGSLSRIPCGEWVLASCVVGLVGRHRAARRVFRRLTKK